MSHYTQQELDSLGVGYGLDETEYAFVEPDEGSPLLKIVGVVTYDDDWGYFPSTVDGREMLKLSVPFFAWQPRAVEEPEWPKLMLAPWGTDEVYRLEFTGMLLGTDRECMWCDDGTQTDNETGEVTECTRCEGDGYVDSPGGPFACYSLHDLSELEQLVLGTTQD